MPKQVGVLKTNDNETLRHILDSHDKKRESAKESKMKEKKLNPYSVSLQLPEYGKFQKKYNRHPNANNLPSSVSPDSIEDSSNEQLSVDKEQIKLLSCALNEIHQDESI